MSLVRWPSSVNKKIIDSTTITIGENAYVENKSDSGNFSDRYLTSLFSPDSYQVVMDFDWQEKDSNGDSEFDRFVKWYKYDEQRGANSFEFPSIARFGVNGNGYYQSELGESASNPKYRAGNSVELSRYKITSALQVQKSGFCYRVTMTWIEVFTKTVEFPDGTAVPQTDTSDVSTLGRMVVQYNGEVPATVTESDVRAKTYLKNRSYDSKVDISITSVSFYIDHVVVLYDIADLKSLKASYDVYYLDTKIGRLVVA